MDISWKILDGFYLYNNNFLRFKTETPGVELGEADLVFEFMLNALRLSEGFELGLFEQRTGLDVSVVTGSLDRLQAEGLLSLEGSCVKATALGQRFLDDVVARFFEGAPATQPASPP